MAVNIDEENNLIADGIWEEFDGSKFLIASTSSPAFQRMVTKLNAPYRRKIERGTLDPITAKRLLCKAMASSLVLDWKNVVDKAGKEVKFSQDIAEKLLHGNDLLREFVQEIAFDLENYRMEDAENLGKG